MIAGIAAIAAFIAALVMLILGGLGLAHARRVSPAADILSGHPADAVDQGTSPLQDTPASGQQLSEEDLFTAASGSSNGRTA